jgi:hypothetical protein
MKINDMDIKTKNRKNEKILCSWGEFMYDICLRIVFQYIILTIIIYIIVRLNILVKSILLLYTYSYHYISHILFLFYIQIFFLL